MISTFNIPAQKPSQALLERLKQLYSVEHIAEYDACCIQPFELPDVLQILIENAGYWLHPESPVRDDHWPAAEYTLIMPSFIEGSIEVDYRMRLEISKLFPAYQLYLSYEIANPDPDALGPTLQGFGEAPYTQSQMRFLADWEKQTKALGWEHLSLPLCDTLLSDWLPEPTAFPQESLWRHLAFDLLERCPD